MKKLRAKVCMLIGVGLVASAGMMVGNNIVADQQAGQMAVEVVSLLEEEIRLLEKGDYVAASEHEQEKVQIGRAHV